LCMNDPGCTLGEVAQPVQESKPGCKYPLGEHRGRRVLRWFMLHKARRPEEILDMRLGKGTLLCPGSGATVPLLEGSTSSRPACRVCDCSRGVDDFRGRANEATRFAVGGCASQMHFLFRSPSPSLFLGPLRLCEELLLDLPGPALACPLGLFPQRLLWLGKRRK